MLFTLPNGQFTSKEEQYLVVGFLSKGDPAQSEFVKAFTHKWTLALYRSPHLGRVLRYLTIQRTTYQWGQRGLAIY